MKIYIYIMYSTYGNYYVYEKKISWLKYYAHTLIYICCTRTINSFEKNI